MQSGAYKTAIKLWCKIADDTLKLQRSLLGLSLIIILISTLLTVPPETCDKPELPGRPGQWLHVKVEHKGLCLQSDQQTSTSSRAWGFSGPGDMVVTAGWRLLGNQRQSGRRSLMPAVAYSAFDMNEGVPGWLSGWLPAFGPRPDPGVPDESHIGLPAWSLLLPLSLSLPPSLCVSHE